MTHRSATSPAINELDNMCFVGHTINIGHIIHRWTLGNSTIMQSVLEHMTIQPDADLNKADQTALLVILDQMVVNKNTKCQHQYALH